MNKREMAKRIGQARKLVQKEISGQASHGKLAGALASEGYAGGYRDALDDVLLLLSAGVNPRRRNYWDSA